MVTSREDKPDEVRQQMGMKKFMLTAICEVEGFQVID
jgi:hypothetical protein